MAKKRKKKNIKKRKAFTLIELLAVVVILGLLVAVAYPAVNKYINNTKETTYTLHEADMKTAASNMMSECIQNDTEDCVPEPGESKTIYLSELVDTKYSNPIKDPDKKDGFCKNDKSYVIVTNTGTSTVKLDYDVCLTCDKYASGKCEELQPGGTCDSASDTTKPVCGDVVGSSTLWTNKDRVISVKCSDTGCGCTKETFYKTFNETGKKGKITITDKSGKTEECEVNVYIDKDIPTCTLEVIGTMGENGWYGGTAPVIKFTSKNDATSGIATYGLGLSKNNPEFNKLDSYTVTQGISTIFGYVKDNAGNIGTCSVEVQYDSIPATVDTVDYGNIVYPKEDIATIDANNRTITLDKTILDEYGEIFGVYFYQTAASTGMTATIKNGTTTLKTVTLSSGVTTPIRVLFDSPIIVSSNNITIDLGATNNVNKISRIELITRNDTVGYYTNKDVTIYINSHDSLSGKAYYTFDGVNYSDINYHTYTKNTNSVIVGLEDHAGNRNDLETFKITNIDKNVPSCTLIKSRAKDGNGEDWYKSSVDVIFQSQSDAEATSANAKSKVRDWSLNNPTGRGNPKSRTQDAATTGVTDTGYVIDNAGNVNSCQTIVRLDLTDPTAGTVTMKAGGSTIASGAEVNKDVTITLANGSDAGSVQSDHYTTKYTVKREGSVVDDSITASKTYSAEGDYEVIVTTTDQSGRTSTRSYTFMIDKTAPSCGTVSGGSTTWINSTRNISVGCSDPNGSAQSGCTASSFSGSWSSSTKTSSITIKDQAGNTKACAVNVYVDVDKPTCGTITGQSTTWTNQKRTISVKCNDTGGSECKQTSFSNSWSSTTKTGSITIQDTAGNTNSCGVNVYVDTTDPYCEFQDQVGGLNETPPFGYFMLRDAHSGVSSATPSANVGYDYWTYGCTDLCGFDVIIDNAGNSASCYLRVGTKTGYQKQQCTLGARCSASGSCTGSYSCPSGGTLTGNTCSGGNKTVQQNCTCVATNAHHEFSGCGTYVTCGAGYTQGTVTWNGRYDAQLGCWETDGTSNLTVVRKVSCTWNGNYNASCSQWGRSVSKCGCAGSDYWEDTGAPTTSAPCNKSTDKSCNYYTVTLYYVASVG